MLGIFQFRVLPVLSGLSDYSIADMFNIGPKQSCKILIDPKSNAKHEYTNIKMSFS